MELGNFFKLLVRHKFTLIIIPLISIIITYFLVRNQADNYSSDTQIATGLVDKTQQALSTNTGGATQESIEQDFDNLIEIMRSKKVVDQVGYQLMIHDLTSPKPFRKPSKLFTQLNASAKKHALSIYTDFYNGHKALSLYDPDQNGLNNLLISMKYDNESLLKTLNIYRAQTSDFIDIDFNADNSELSAFVVNTLANEFITYYNFVVKDNQHKAITFLAGLLKTKKDTLDARINTLRIYKVQNQILNLSDQSAALYSQIAGLQTHLDQAQRDVISNQGAIKNIDDRYKAGGRRSLESATAPVNQSLVTVTDQIKNLNAKYIQSNFDPKYKNKIDSLQRIVNEKILQSNDKNLVNPTANQQSLVQERLTLQVQYDLAKNSIGFIQSEIGRLNDQLHQIVPHEAVIEQDQGAIDIAQKEYLDVLGKFNQASLDANYTSQIKQLETAMPGEAEPSKKMLLVILSGIISFVFCVLVFFLLYFFDNTIKSPEELANKTGIPVMGYLNLLPGPETDLKKIWNDPNPNAEVYKFRNLLQSIRFEIDSELAGSKILIIDSLEKAEGKTFLAANLSFAYSLVNKKVLLIDGNFDNPGITTSFKPSLYIEDYFNGGFPDFVKKNPIKINVLGNKGGYGSLLEITDNNTIKEKLEKLRAAFDVIIIETSSLDTLNKAKEWNQFSDKILAVYESGKAIKDAQDANVNYLKNLNGKFIGWVLNTTHKV